MVANAYLVDLAVRGAKEYQIAFFFFFRPDKVCCVYIMICLVDMIAMPNGKRDIH